MTSVLLISPFFYPEPISTGKYNAALVNALVQRGCQVTVICSHPIYPDWRPQDAWAELEGVLTIRGGLNVRYPKSIVLRRCVLELWFLIHVLISGARLRNNFDVVISVFPPNLYSIIAALVFKGHVRKVGIVHDLQSIHAVAGRTSLISAILRRVINAIECFTFRRCRKIIALSQQMARQIVNYGAMSRRHVAVCYPFPTVNFATNLGENLKELMQVGHKHVVYAGALGRKQNPRELMNFMRLAATRLPTVHFHIFSGGRDFEALRFTGKEGALKNLFFHSLVAEKDLAELYVRSDVQILPQAPGTESGAMPSKVPNIVASECALFSICDPASEMALLTSRYDLGIFESNWDPVVLVDRLEYFLKNELSDWRDRKKSMARQEAAKIFSIDNLIDEILT